MHSFFFIENKFVQFNQINKIFFVYNYLLENNVLLREMYFAIYFMDKILGFIVS